MEDSLIGDSHMFSLWWIAPGQQKTITEPLIHSMCNTSLAWSPQDVFQIVYQKIWRLLICFCFLVIHIFCRIV